MNLESSQILPQKKSFLVLKDALPLAMPLSVMIEPTNVCNFKCKFCPTGDYELLKSVGRPKGMMKFDLFCKIIDELSQMCQTHGTKLKTLLLYKDGEPLLNKHICQMIAYAKQKQVSESILLTTNASLLDQKMAQGLIESGLDAIRISVEHIGKKNTRRSRRTMTRMRRLWPMSRACITKRLFGAVPLKSFPRLLTQI